MARGGIADPDAPLDNDSIRYRVSLSIEEDEIWSSETAVSTTGLLHNQDALRIQQLGTPSVGTQVASADPMGLVREQLASLAAAATPDSMAPSTPSLAPSRPSGRERGLSLSLSVFCAVFCW